MSEQKIVPNLWFDKEAEEAAKFYTSLFKNSEVLDAAHYSETGQEVHRQEPGETMTVEYALDGFRFTALNGGPIFKFNPSVSFVVSRSKEEVDALWEELAQDALAQQVTGRQSTLGGRWAPAPKISQRLPEPCLSDS